MYGSTADRTTTVEGDDPNWSPNGKRITYESYRDGDGEIFSSLSTGGHENLLTDNGADDTDPAYSPNGKAIVFVSDRGPGDNEIFRMNSEGSSEHRVTDNDKDEESPDWGAR